ncbi:ABC transporter permease [Pseudonocardia sichuanensis]|uniref:Peptide/nickel transport system permease protein n=1 Tax=Pseudonocardia kunmingensis TaxID=630975 RepID=A0A543D9W3_9PSEU|nr:ABC transporter permease [Pseudonocardia kunmingensis]TQM06068.1 peptide/nickel transport system permease protein [Pseudonocardia kunmingensis]
MLSILARRLVRAAAALVVACALVAAAVELLPGDAAEVRAGPYATPAAVEQVRAEQGLDRPAVIRWLEWAGAAVRGDLGTSALSDRPVLDMLAQRWPATAALAGLSLLVAVPLTALAVAAALRRRRGGDALLTAAVAVPQVVVAGALTAVLAGLAGWLPPVSLLAPGTPVLAQPRLLVLPVLSLALPTAAFAAVLLRGAAADAVDAPHVRDARLRGLSPWVVTLRYVAGALAAPAVGVFAVVGGALIAGTALVESVFGVAGLGELLVTAVATRDMVVVQAVAAIAATAVLAGLTVAEVVADLTTGPGRS